MALITFRNTERRDVTVYAVAGSHKKTVLEIAKEHKIPLNHDCQDGECGNCLIKVVPQDTSKERVGLHLNKKEKTVLRELGKITKEELEHLEVNDLPSTWRLACQMIPRDEDILIEYEE